PRSTLFPYTTLFRSNLMSDRVDLEKRVYAYLNYAYRLRVGWNPENRLAFGLGLGVIHSAFDNAGWDPSDAEPISLENSFLPDARSEEHTSELQSREN